MREMKDSGDNWIGSIPKEWNVKRIKNVVVSMSKGNGITKDEVILNGDTPCVRYGEIYSKYDNGFTRCISATNVHLIPSPQYFGYGDILCAATGELVEEIGKSVVYLGDGRCLAGGDIIVIHHNQVPSFFNYSLNCHCSQAQKSCKKTKLKVVHISTSDIGSVIMALPPIEEQRRIADFLDRKCADIDNVLLMTKTSIKEYKKLKQSVITEAVTKGIRGERPMKDSGIEWIGEIPEEWTVIKFGYCAHIKSNLVDPSLYPDYPQIAPDVIGKGNAKIEGEITSVKESGIISWNHLFSKGQIIYSKIRPLLNKLIIAPFDGLCSADMYPIESDLDISFTKYMMLSSYFLEQVKQVTEDRVKMPKVNQEELSAFKVVIPPCKSEQVAIASYLDQKCSEIDSLIASKEKFIAKLESYKKSLIYEYATGKKEVPSNA